MALRNDRELSTQQKMSKEVHSSVRLDEYIIYFPNTFLFLMPTSVLKKANNPTIPCCLESSQQLTLLPLPWGQRLKGKVASASPSQREDEGRVSCEAQPPILQKAWTWPEDIDGVANSVWTYVTHPETLRRGKTHRTGQEWVERESQRGHSVRRASTSAWHASRPTVMTTDRSKESEE